MKATLRFALPLAAALGLSIAFHAPAVQAAPGDLLATVTLPGNGDCNVGGEAMLFGGGVLYIAVNGSFGTGCASSSLDIYSPPALPGPGVATLIATKTLQDGVGDPVLVSVVAWDPTRAVLWAAYADTVYSIALGDPTISGPAVSTFAFSAGVGGFDLIDGLAYDVGNDTLWYSPDVDCCAYEFGLPGGGLLSTVISKDAGGLADGLVSGVAVGSANSLYIGRNGENVIRLIDKTTGDFISTFATTVGRVEDLTCDPVTYAPLEAILAKDTYTSLYEAFEVEEGTCPLPGVLEKLITSGPDADLNGVIDLAVLAPQTSSLHYDFTIFVNPTAAENPLVDPRVEDRVPAEWDVTCVDDGDACDDDTDVSVGLPLACGASDFVGDVTLARGGKLGKDCQSDTSLVWLPNAEDPSALRVNLQSRLKNKSKNYFSPTSCGALYLNYGAKLYDGDTLIAETPPLIIVALNDLNGGGIVADGTGDEDDDGLTDIDEARIYGTNPCDADSDGDGVDDGDEVEAGTDPLDPLSYPS